MTKVDVQHLYRPLQFNCSIKMKKKFINNFVYAHALKLLVLVRFLERLMCVLLF